MGDRLQLFRAAREFFPVRARHFIFAVSLAAIIQSPRLCLGNPPPGLGSVTLTWNPVPGADSYNVYYGTVSRSYDQMVSVSTNQVTVSGLKLNTPYFFAVTCVVGGLESGFSDEILFTPSPGQPVLQLAALAGGAQTVSGTAPGGHNYDVLASQDLVLWKAIGVIAAGVDGSFSFVDPAAAQYAQRFYRLHETTYTAPGTLPTILLLPPPSAPGQLQITGQLGHLYDVLESDDLPVWNVIGTVTAGARGAAAFIDPESAQYPNRSYMVHDVTFLSATPTYTTARAPDGTLSFQVFGLFGHTYQILGMTDFISWWPLGQVTIGMSGTATFNAPSAAGLCLQYAIQEITGP